MPSFHPFATRFSVIAILAGAVVAGCTTLPGAAPRRPAFVPITGTFPGRLSVTSVGVYLIPCDRKRGAVPIANPEALSPTLGAAFDDRFVRITGRIELGHSVFEGAPVPTLEVKSLVALPSAPCRIEPGQDTAASTSSRP